MFEVGDLVTLEKRKIVILDIIDYKGYKLAFCDHISDDEQNALHKYVIMLIQDDGLCEVVDKQVINEVTPIFTNNLKKFAE